jgi:hypothetical protein
MKWYTSTEHFSIIVCILMFLWMFRIVLHLYVPVDVYQHISCHTGYIYCWHSLVNLKIIKALKTFWTSPLCLLYVSNLRWWSMFTLFQTFTVTYTVQITELSLANAHDLLHCFSLLAAMERHQWRNWGYKCCRILSAWLSEECKKTEEEASPWSNLFHIDFWVHQQWGAAVSEVCLKSFGNSESEGFLELHHTAIIIL